ncbi:nucleotidyl transferase AbiEii/AbiGii toxin family protein [Telmatocola sphagniphila]|uniref:Nucleotidyl transferase AbiEii/AbiGii toxin family protein n=1 Tax=Telmatocola sphagniphila TaxID=1123043 RepID=A0A8E6EVT7_9BACT|nr:nucleotidyl transferase AbiEii/AbiGii toxin family protein [Telmatocola sphagniphila]QVL33037.1 nucleotidyl transferase AbiEii/AbiGii toxin family protein [Telmatocola sphagniphila]
MDDVARLSIADRSDLFRESARSRGLTAAIIEKDFWVCWTLKRIFSLPELPSGLLFKGGTSLSKVFGIIDRFSEDVDLSFDRSGLGFAGDNDPQRASSGKKRKQGLKALEETCQRVIRNQLLPRLHESFRNALGESWDSSWNLQLAADDQDGQTLLFHYPTTSQDGQTDALAYIRSSVRLEIGARSENWPARDATIVPYVSQDFPSILKEPGCRVDVLAAERTFWEKITLLHMWHHAPARKKFRDRQSRHYFDVVRLHEHEIGKAAIKDIELFLKVAKHKEIFFPAAWARYAEARPGSLCLVPPKTRLPELERDYRLMSEMIFGEKPTFDELLAKLRGIEAQINEKAGG